MGDRLGLAAGLGLAARIGTRRIDKADHWQAVLFGEAHQPHRFAVTFRVRHAEVGFDILFHTASLAVADQHHLASADRGETANQGAVIAEQAIAVKLHKVIAHQTDVIRDVGAFRMARDLHNIPCRQFLLSFLSHKHSPENVIGHSRVAGLPSQYPA